MPRFSDQWVVDRTLFEFATGGSCACCGFSHLFLPNGLKGLIDEVSDLETDAANNEFEAAQKSPWPPTMRDQVWADRVRLRHLMKKEMGQYSDFMTEVGGTEGLKQFLTSNEVGPSKLRRIIQMPRTEVTERVRSQYGIHSALGIVICAVVEQVANFEMTKYPADGRSEAELAFESTLKYDRRGGFVLPIASRNEETRKFDIMNEDVLDVLVKMVESLGGPKLLDRAPKKTKPKADDGSDEGDDSDDDEGGADDADEAPVPGQTGPSFRSDRRIIRLLIARYWADQIIQKYKALKKEQEEAADNKEGGQDPKDISKREDNVEAVTAGVHSLSTS